VTDLVQIDALTGPQTDQLCEFYRNEWWSSGREPDDVRIMLASSSVIVALAERESGRLVAFSRILTDFVFSGMVYDVIVAPEWRSRQIGRRLVEAIVTHPRLRLVQSLRLCCLPNMVPFYEKWGFQVIAGDLQWMMRSQRTAVEAG